MPFQIVHQDITKMNTEAIVNAANACLEQGGGVCGAIFRAAGEMEMRKVCRQIGYCPTGSAVITPGFGLAAKYVIHAVGPIWRGGGAGERKLLEDTYRKSLELAAEHELKSIAFPLISSGIYGYPKAEALQVAIGVFAEFLADHEMDICLAVFDRKAVALSEKLFSNIAHYIDTYYVEEPRRRRREEDICGSESLAYSVEVKSEVTPEEEFHRIVEAMRPTAAPKPLAPCARPSQPMDGAGPKSAGAVPIPEFLTKKKKARDLDDVINNPSETFSEMVLRLIDEKGKKDSEVYKKANIDRKHFSKIRSKPDYNPKKSTAIALAIGLELSLDQTVDLLAKAGYSLSPCSKFDMIIRYFIENGEYDMFTINEALFCFEQPMLGV